MNLQRRRSQDDEEPSTIAQDGETVHATLMFMDAQQREVQSRYQVDGSQQADAERAEAEQARADRMARTADAWRGNSNTLPVLRDPTLQHSRPKSQNQLPQDPSLHSKDQGEAEAARQENMARKEEAWRNPPLGYAIRSF